MADPFDTVLARFPTQVVALVQVVDLLHVTHRADRVAELKSAMEQGACFPPISVVRFGARYIVADGHKRLSAARELCFAKIVVEVWPWRRLAADLGRQHLRFLRRLAAALAQLARGGAERRAGRRFLAETAEHCLRIARSLARLRGNR
ncbi:MAG: ParB N-terminal domain-containing protein [Acidobacteriota bacterium]